MISRYVHRSKFVRKELAKIDRAIKVIKVTGRSISTDLVRKRSRLINYPCDDYIRSNITN